MKYTIDLTWDREAAVWVATSDDIAGLALESDSLDVLIERAKGAAAELLDLNGKGQKRAQILFRSSRVEELSPA
jgi:predicted RNase H-like HicB family nuclease